MNGIVRRIFWPKKNFKKTINFVSKSQKMWKFMKNHQKHAGLDRAWRWDPSRMKAEVFIYIISKNQRVIWGYKKVMDKLICHFLLKIQNFAKFSRFWLLRTLQSWLKTFECVFINFMKFRVITRCLSTIMTDYVIRKSKKVNFWLFSRFRPYLIIVPF